LPMVGEFMQQAIRNKVIDGNDRFVDEFDTSPPPPPDSSLSTMRDWIRGLFRTDPQQPPLPGMPPRPAGAGGLPPVTSDPPGSVSPPVPAEDRVGGE